MIQDYIKKICIEFYKAFTNADYAERYIELKKPDWMLTKIKDGEIILDVGCGKPVDAIRVAFLGGYYVGVDISTKELAQGKYLLKERFPELWNFVNFVVADAARLPFRDSVFDISTSYSAIEHVHDSLRKAWISKMVRVTKVGGSIVVTLQNKLSLICYLFLPFRVFDVDALCSPKIMSLLAQYILYWLSKIFPSLKKFLVLRTDYYEDFMTPVELFKFLTSHGLRPVEFDAGSLYYWGYAPPRLAFTEITLRVSEFLSRLEKSALNSFLKHFCLRFGYRCIKVSETS